MGGENNVLYSELLEKRNLIPRELYLSRPFNKIVILCDAVRESWMGGKALNKDIFFSLPVVALWLWEKLHHGGMPNKLKGGLFT